MPKTETVGQQAAQPQQQGKVGFDWSQLQNALQDLGAAAPTLVNIILELVHAMKGPDLIKASPRIKDCCDNETIACLLHCQAHAMAAALQLACQQAPPPPNGGPSQTEAPGKQQQGHGAA